MNSSISKLLYGGGIFFDILKWLILVVIVVTIINSYWYSIFLVDGVSMETSFMNKQMMLSDKSFYRGEADPERGEVVIVKYPGDPQNKQYLKRVIGLPTEKVVIAKNKVYINGKALEESYISPGTEIFPSGTWTLKNNEYFLMGDNRPQSNDSRYFGPVEKRFFVGKAIFMIYPVFQGVGLPRYNI
ncbi:MAG: signal peptidase I [Patescibacteria group bacterium]|jgi:signal peptidase I